MADYLVQHFKSRLDRLQHEFQVKDYELQSVQAVLELDPQVHKEYGVGKGRIDELKYRETVLKADIAEIRAEYSSVTVAYNRATHDIMQSESKGTFDA